MKGSHPGEANTLSALHSYMGFTEENMDVAQPKPLCGTSTLVEKIKSISFLGEQC